MKNAFKSQSGFSLIELMVVVAIIGILASVAIPNFQRFQAKSRQSEAKSNLAAVYTAEKAFHSEWDKYYGDFRDIGFSPEGQLRYAVGFAAAGAAPPAPFVANDSGGGLAAGLCFNSDQTVGTCVPNASVHPSKPAWAAALAAGGCGATQTPTAGFGAAAQFNATAIGGIGGPRADVWSMNQAKVLCNNVSGL